MFINPADYLKRITHTLQYVVAPKVESDFERGQVLAAVFLLDQLLDRIDYKPQLIEQEIKSGRDMVEKIMGSFEDKGGKAPDEIAAFIEETAGDALVINIALRDKCDRALSAAIDYFFANKGELDAADAHKLEGQIISQFMQIGGRDLGMLKLSTSGKLIQTKD